MTNREKFYAGKKFKLNGLTFSYDTDVKCLQDSINEYAATLENENDKQVTAYLYFLSVHRVSLSVHRVSAVLVFDSLQFIEP